MSPLRVGLVATVTPAFRKLRSFNTPFGIPVSKYVSDQTGLQVVIVDVEAPIVNGFFAVATEEAGRWIDKGQPHTLEHLVFLGSEDYPFKGILDSLANRALAQGTNAWTADDHTCYTITTAGQEGFKNIMPIFLDHILYPTLTEAGFITEVHHVNGKGEDAGVVYCEMQGRENTAYDLLSVRLGRQLYPAPSGYRSQTGGLMAKLRELDIDQIRKYHSTYYRPDNLCIIITGKVNHDSMLHALEPFERKVISKGPLASQPRPWVDSALVPQMLTSNTEVVEFPDEDESTGTVYIGYRGPHITEFNLLGALDTLFTYLTESPVAVLNRTFVEIESPECSDIDYDMQNFLETSYYIAFSNANVTHLHTIADKFTDVLRKIVAGDKEFSMDMERMRLVIDRKRLTMMNEVEQNPHDMLSDPIITDFLYGDRKAENLSQFVDSIDLLVDQLKHPASYWIKLINDFLIIPPSVTIIGKPSATLAKKLTDDEKARTQLQRETLGEEKLSQLAKKLENAIAENERPIPPDIINNFSVPNLNIAFPKVVSASMVNCHKYDNDFQKYIDQFGQQVPYFIELDEVQSQFITAVLYFDTVTLSRRLRLYLELYLEAMFSLPITSPRGSFTYEEVVKGINNDIVCYNNDCGQGGANFSCGVFETQIRVNIRLEATQQKYERGLQWLEDIIYYSIFDPNRLLIAAKKLLSDVPQNKRRGMTIASLKMNMVLLNEESNHIVTDLVTQTRFLKSVIDRLTEDAKSIVNDLNEFRTLLTKPEHLRIHVYGACRKIPDIITPWTKFRPPYKIPDVPRDLKPIKLTRDYLSPVGRHPTSIVSEPNSPKISQIVSLASIESGFLMAVTNGISSFEDADLAPLMILCEYFETTEGLFWKQIRGPGLAYGCSLRISVSSGHLTLVIYRSADTYVAYSRAQAIVASVINGETKFDSDTIEAAKSSVTFSIVNDEDSPNQAAEERWINTVFKRVDPGHNRHLLLQLANVQQADLERVLHKYLGNLFKKDRSVVVVVSGPGKVSEIKQGFADIGINMDEQNLDEVFADLGETDDDEDDEEDSEDEDCSDSYCSDDGEKRDC